MAKPFDATLKQILDDYSPDWAAWFAPLFGLPSGPLEPLDPDLSTVQPTADKVFRLPGNAGLLHLEVQTSWDGTLPDRVFLYNALLHDRYGGPVRSLVLLLRPEANATAVTGILVRVGADGQEYLRFGYGVVRVWDLDPDALLAGGLGIAPLGLLTRAAEPRLPELVQRLADRVDREITDVGRRDRLLASSYILLGMLYDDAVMRAVFTGVQKMRESSTYQAILREGRAEGRAEGRVEGRVEARQEILLDLLSERCGVVPAELEARIRGTTDLERLRLALHQVLHITSPDELVL